MWKHPARGKLEAGKRVPGVTITTPSIESAALCATLGFNFPWVEMEHSTVTLESLRAAIILATSAWSKPSNYRHSADANMMTVVVIEEAQAVQNIAVIATSDLSLSLGLRDRQNELQLDENLAKAVTATKKHGKFLGLLRFGAKALGLAPAPAKALY